jgi:PPOX class probable F420-dependent enzyme
MTIFVPATHQDLVSPPRFLTFITVMPDGTPQASMVWFRYEDGCFLVSIEKGSQKHLNLKRSPKVTLFGADPENAYRYIEIRGESVELTPATPDWIDALCMTYTGKRYFGVFMPVERSNDMLIARIEPKRIREVDLSFFLQPV